MDVPTNKLAEKIWTVLAVNTRMQEEKLKILKYLVSGKEEDLLQITGDLDLRDMTEVIRERFAI